jgi:hypothetical protein
MVYQPNVSDAIGAYRAVVAWLYNVPLQLVDRPSITSVQVQRWGEYHIVDGGLHNARGHKVFIHAICAYDAEAALWLVHLPRGGVLRVQGVGDRFTVVSREQ